jgi:LacI family transcriptional regulator
VVRFVRDHACDGLTVGRMVKKMGVSRRTLERLFTEHVGHSPSEEIRRVRLARVRQLLAGTDIGYDEVARMTGFAHLETMRRVFKGEFGISPGDYRLRGRPKGGV